MARKNKSNPDRLKRLWEKTGGLCAHCGRPASSRTRTVDHFIPRSKGGGYDIRNLMPLCQDCNKARGTKWINPYSFYKYAPDSLCRKCLDYAEELKYKHRTMSDVE